MSARDAQLAAMDRAGELPREQWISPAQYQAGRIAGLERQVAELTAKLVQSELHAARYRWLRHGDNDECVIQHGPLAPDYHWLPRNERLDAMIDTPTPDRSPMAQVSDLACAARDLAASYGMVLTVKQQPLLPLAMGNYETVVYVRLAKEKSK